MLTLAMGWRLKLGTRTDRKSETGSETDYGLARVLSTQPGGRPAQMRSGWGLPAHRPTAKHLRAIRRALRRSQDLPGLPEAYGRAGIDPDRSHALSDYAAPCIAKWVSFCSKLRPENAPAVATQLRFLIRKQRPTRHGSRWKPDGSCF